MIRITTLPKFQICVYSPVSPCNALLLRPRRRGEVLEEQHACQEADDARGDGEMRRRVHDLVGPAALVAPAIAVGGGSQRGAAAFARHPRVLRAEDVVKGFLQNHHGLGRVQGACVKGARLAGPDARPDQTDTLRLPRAGRCRATRRGPRTDGGERHRGTIIHVVLVQEIEEPLGTLGGRGTATTRHDDDSLQIDGKKVKTGKVTLLQTICFMNRRLIGGGGLVQYARTNVTESNQSDQAKDPSREQNTSNRRIFVSRCKPRRSLGTKKPEKYITMH